MSCSPSGADILKTAGPHQALQNLESSIEPYRHGEFIRPSYYKILVELVSYPFALKSSAEDIY